MVRNTMFQMKLLRDSFVTPERAIENFHYPGYVIRLQKERQLQTKRKKIERKCPSLSNMKLFIINIKIIDCFFFKCTEDR